MKKYLKPELAVTEIASKQPISNGLAIWLESSGAENTNEISVVAFSVES